MGATTTGLLIACAVAVGCRPAPPAAPAQAPRPATATRPAPAPRPALATRAARPHVATPPAIPEEPPWIPRSPRRTITTSTSLVILEPIQFVGATAVLDPRSAPILDALAATFTGNPSILLVGVRAFGADARAGARRRLGQQRAAQVVEELVVRGIERDRLQAHGAARPAPGESGIPSFLILRRATDPATP